MNDIPDTHSSEAITWCLLASVFLHLIIVAAVTASYNKSKLVRIKPKPLLIELRNYSKKPPKSSSNKNDTSTLSDQMEERVPTINTDQPKSPPQNFQSTNILPQPTAKKPTRELNLTLPSMDETENASLETPQSIQGTVFNPTYRKAIEHELNAVEIVTAKYYDSYTAHDGVMVERYDNKCFKTQRAIPEDITSEIIYFRVKCTNTAKSSGSSQYLLP
jgi:hypothetical protein